MLLARFTQQAGNLLILAALCRFRTFLHGKQLPGQEILHVIQFLLGQQISVGGGCRTGHGEHPLSYGISGPSEKARPMWFSVGIS
jgi:hypothetical protein